MLAWAVLPRSASAAPAGAVIDAQNSVAVQSEPEDAATGRYDWGPVVMRDGDLYKMWWTRLGGGREKRFPCNATLPDGAPVPFEYPDWGDRIYYAESKDGRTWRIGGEDFAGPPEAYGPDAAGPLQALRPSETRQQIHHVACPSVVKAGKAYYLYYEAPSEYAAARRPDGSAAVGDEYHNQIFVALSEDGRRWTKHPAEGAPQPIVPAPESNRTAGRRYGLGQPSVFYRNGRFVMHYVDSCTGAGDFIVRLEADNPFFRNAIPFPKSLRPAGGSDGIPRGAVARFAQTDVRFLGDAFCLLRPAYGTGNVGLLASRGGVFKADADAAHPRDVFPQIRIRDPRGEAYTGRHAPRFLTGPAGEILVENGKVVLYYGSGMEDKGGAYTWDIHRCAVPVRALAGPTE